MSHYSFSPLEPGQIRLLSLSPASGDESIHGKLDVVFLEDYKPNNKHGLSFEALSYVWGSDLMPCELIMPTGSVPITKSLHNFLKRLRLEHGHRTLWADAVCINQSDIPEKESQVPLMSAIFSTASCVLADLGMADAETETVIRFMRHYWHWAIWAGGHKRTYGFPLDPSELAFVLGIPMHEIPTREQGEKTPEPEDEQWQMITRFFAREWFSRAWIVQDFVLAREIVFYCGQHTLDWRQLVAVTADFDPSDQTTLWALPNFTEMRHGTGMQRFSSSGHLRCTRILQQTLEGLVFIAKLQINRTWRQLSSPCFIDLLHRFQSCKCRLGRDRYFALAQLATDVVTSDRASLRPDYTISLRELILHYSRFVIGTAKGSEMFMRSGLWLQQQSDLPTWLEDFTQLSNRQIDISVTNQSDNAAGDTEFVVTFDRDVPNSITIGARLVEIVVDVNSLSIAKELNLDAILAHVKANAQTIERTRQRLPGLYKDDLDVAQVSVMAMCAATYEGPMLDSMVIGLEILRLCSMLPEGSRN